MSKLSEFKFRHMDRICSDQFFFHCIESHLGFQFTCELDPTEMQARLALAQIFSREAYSLPNRQIFMFLGQTPLDDAGFLSIHDALLCNLTKNCFAFAHELRRVPG